MRVMINCTGEESMVKQRNKEGTDHGQDFNCGG